VSSIAGILLASLFPDDWGLELAGTLALLPLIVSAIATRSTLAAVGIASIVALLAFDLPYRIGLPIAVLAALAAGSIADAVIARVAPDRVRKPRAPAALPATREAPPGESAPTRPDTTRPDTRRSAR
jgi:predicted branched-subunit amino acid permease